MIAVKQFVSRIQGKNSPPPINFFLFLYLFPHVFVRKALYGGHERGDVRKTGAQLRTIISFRHTTFVRFWRTGQLDMRLFDGFERTNRVDTIQHRIHEQLHEQRESHGRAGRNHITQRRAFHFEIQCGHIQSSRQQSADETA